MVKKKYVVLSSPQEALSIWILYPTIILANGPLSLLLLKVNQIHQGFKTMYHAFVSKDKSTPRVNMPCTCFMAWFATHWKGWYRQALAPMMISPCNADKKTWDGTTGTWWRLSKQWASIASYFLCFPTVEGTKFGYIYVNIDAACSKLPFGLLW